MLSISMLHECISLEIRIDDKLCNLICLYRCPSQNMEEFETCDKNLEFNLELNRITGIQAIRLQLAGLNLRSLLPNLDLLK